MSSFSRQDEPLVPKMPEQLQSLPQLQQPEEVEAVTISELTERELLIRNKSQMLLSLARTIRSQVNSSSHSTVTNSVEGNSTTSLLNYSFSAIGKKFDPSLYSPRTISSTNSDTTATASKINTVTNTVTSTVTNTVTNIVSQTLSQETVYVSIVKDLLAAGADLNYQDSAGITALMELCLVDNRASFTYTGYSHSNSNSRAITLSIARLLLQFGSNTNIQSVNGDTALLWAVKGGNNAMVSLLIHYNANLNSYDKHGNTALIYSTMKGDVDMVRSLIDAGANVNKLNNDGLSALMIAAEANHSAIMKMLIVNDADVNSADTYSILHHCTVYNNYKIVQLLIEHKADVNRSNQSNSDKSVSLYHSTIANSKTICDETEVVLCPIIYAIRNGNVKIVQLFLAANAVLHINDENGNNPLLIATQLGQVRIVELLLKAGINVNYQNPINGYTALMIAIIEDHSDVLNLLLDRPELNVNIINQAPNIYDHINDRYVYSIRTANSVESDPSIDSVTTNANGTTPILLASYKNNLQAIVSLLSRKANPNVQGEGEKTPIHYLIDKVEYRSRIGSKANTSGKDYLTSILHTRKLKHLISVVKELIIAGCDVNKRDSNGCNALALVIQTGHAELIQLLISYGSDLNIVHSSGRYSLMTAAHFNYTDILEILIDACKGNHTIIDQQDIQGNNAAMYAYKRDVLQLLLDAGSYININNNAGTTLLINAAKLKYIDIVQLLIEKGVDLNQQDINQNTALLVAIKNKSFHEAELIIHAGADVNIQNDYGNTALLIATKLESVEMILLLISKGADPNLADNNGCTPLLIAIQHWYSSNTNFEIIMAVLTASNIDYHLIYKYDKTVLDVIREDITFYAMVGPMLKWTTRKYFVCFLFNCQLLERTEYAANDIDDKGKLDSVKLNALGISKTRRTSRYNSSYTNSAANTISTRMFYLNFNFTTDSLYGFDKENVDHSSNGKMSSYSNDSVHSIITNGRNGSQDSSPESVAIRVFSDFYMVRLITKYIGP